MNNLEERIQILEQKVSQLEKSQVKFGDPVKTSPVFQEIVCTFCKLKLYQDAGRVCFKPDCPAR